jgi:hypothetical protein
MINEKAKREINFRVWQLKTEIVIQISLRSFDNFSRFYTTGANLLATVSARRKLNANALQIRVKPTTGFVICM